MPKCPNGHDQGLHLTCSVCGARISYRDASRELLSLLRVQSDFGDVAALFAGLPPASSRASFTAAVTLGNSRKETGSEFTAENIRGGSWFDFFALNQQGLSRWLKVLAFGRARYKFIVVDARDPLSVLTVASVPLAGQTTVVAVTADRGSTAVEQNTSHVAVSVALKRGFSVLAFPQAYVASLLLRTEGDSVVSQTDALMHVVGSLMERADDVMDFMERDLRFGVQLHYVSALTSGSRRIYGAAANALDVQNYQLPEEVGSEDVRTFYSIVSGENDLKDDFQQAFSLYRSRSYKDALSAVCRFHVRTGSTFFDVLTLYGVSEPLVLKAAQAGYNTVAKRDQKLKVGSVI